MAKLSAKQIAALAHDAGFGAVGSRTLATAVAICLAESAGRTDAVNHANSNGSSDFGLWQINSVHADLLKSGSWSNPRDNARMAFRVYADAGRKFTPWSTFNSGAYLAHMGTALRAAQAPDANVPDGAAPSTGTATDAGLGASIAPFLTFPIILANPQTWQRVALFSIGGLLLVIALFKMTGDNRLSDTTKAVAGAAAKAAVVA